MRKEWLLFLLFMMVGVGVVINGMIYMKKEKGDTESIKTYPVMILVMAACICKFFI